VLWVSIGEREAVRHGLTVYFWPSASGLMGLYLVMAMFFGP
jgi:hypothetical protein